MRNTLWYLLAGTRGGPMRARLLLLLKRRPSNANQLATALGVDYTTVQHHVALLIEHGVLSAHGKYGAIYVLTPEMESAWKEFEGIWVQVRRDLGENSGKRLK